MRIGATQIQEKIWIYEEEIEQILINGNCFIRKGGTDANIQQNIPKAKKTHIKSDYSNKDIT